MSLAILSETLNALLRDRELLADASARTRLAVVELEGRPEAKTTVMLRIQGAEYPLSMVRTTIITQLTADADATDAKVAVIDNKLARIEAIVQ